MYQHHDPNLRIGDAEREAVAERLRESHTDGRLDVQEFQERLDRCYQAKTAGELRALVADLPSNERELRWPGFAWRFWPVPLLPIVLTVVVIGAVAHHHAWFGLWLLIPLLFMARLWVWRLGGSGPMRRRGARGLRL